MVEGYKYCCDDESFVGNSLDVPARFNKNSRFVGANSGTDEETKKIEELIKEKKECRNPKIEEDIQEKINHIVSIINKRSKGEETICLKCGSDDLMDYEDIGEGKFCEKCFNEEMEIWKRESGFYNLDKDFVEENN